MADTDDDALRAALAAARELPTEAERQAARDRAVRAYARKGVVRLGALFGLFGIPFVLALIESVGLLPQPFTTQPLAVVGAVGATLGGVYAWAYGAKQFFRIKDRITDRRAGHPRSTHPAPAGSPDRRPAAQEAPRAATTGAQARSATAAPPAAARPAPAAADGPPQGIAAALTRRTAKGGGTTAPARASESTAPARHEPGRRTAGPEQRGRGTSR
ncbi:hypothetical protein [Marinactinospora rubrisoli]|uniref:Uncharacterized protein n=1 Tax=Marinactinospora rubrisoli TaxID=2715399 RepID=A0ABW2KAK0_9ACTN